MFLFKKKKRQLKEAIYSFFFFPLLWTISGIPIPEISRYLFLVISMLLKAFLPFLHV